MKRDKVIVVAIDRIFLEYSSEIRCVFKKYFKEVKLVNKYGIPLENKFKSTLVKKLEKFGKVGQKIINTISSKSLNQLKNLDYSLSIGGECFTLNTITNLRKRFPELVSTKYIFDKTNEGYLKEARLKYDEIYTFEKEDAKIHNLKFRTSFFIDEEVRNRREIDCYYLGGLREGKRYLFIEQLKRYCLKNKLKYDFRLFIKKKYIKDAYKDKEILTSEKLSYKENIEKVKDSKVVIELNYYTQKGLTLRTFECLGVETKLITENLDILNYDFYNKNNIFIVQNQKDIEEIPEDFFKTPYQKIPNDIKEKYSLDGFIKDIFFRSEEKNEE